MHSLRFSFLAISPFRILVVVAILNSCLSFGQSKKIFQETFTKLDGLSLDHISTLCFDNDGFLWLGGSRQDSRVIISEQKKLALQRFNGQSFHNIPLPDFGYPIIEVAQLFKRNDGQFYVLVRSSKESKLVLFNPITTVFTKIEFQDTATKISRVYRYQNNNYILTQKEKTITLQHISDDLQITPLFSFRNETKRIYTLDHDTQFIPLKDYCIISDDNLPVQFIDWEGNILSHTEDASLQTANNKPIMKYYLDEFMFDNNMLYTFVENNPTLYAIDTQEKSINLSTPKVQLLSTHLKIYTDPKGNNITLAAHKNMLGLYTLGTNGFQLKYKFAVNKMTAIRAISKNVQKDIWIAANGKLHYIKFPNTKVTTYLDSLSLRTVVPLDAKNYLAATESRGWFTVNTETNEVRPYIVTKKGKSFEPYSSRNIFIEDTIIWANSGTNIMKVNPKTRETTHFKHYPIICLERPNDSTIVYGTNAYNLMEFNTKTEVHSPLLKTDSLYIFDLEIKDNLVVAGTDKGLLTYHLITKEHAFYGKEQLEDPFILMLDYHEDIGFLAGSRSGTIVVFDADKKSCKTVYEDDLKSGIATITFEDSNWWINTFNGVVLFDPKTGSKTRFSEKDGFSHHEGNRYSSLKTNDGIFTGSIAGLNYFNPKELNITKDSASLTLLKVRKYNTHTKAFENQFDRTQFNSNNTIVLPAENSALELDFGLKHTNAVNTNATYAYRLNQSDWIELRNQNSLQFPNLASGNYLLEIEAFDYSGSKIANPLAIQIVSQNFFYKTWWFLLLLILTVVGFLVWRLKQLQTRKKLQEQFAYGLIQSQENERKRIAKELHDSINQQLTLIKKKAQNSQQTEITELTHNTLEEVRAISRNLYPPLLKQLGLTESIKQLILDLDEEHALFFSEEIDEIDTYFDEDATLNFYRFIQECITNVLKHANAKAIAISIEKQQQEIITTIKDNGRGFDVSEQKKQNSLGLKTITERIKIMKGSLQIDSELGKGTTITTIIPIQYGN
ncbi:MAG: sensor histidine kinase [Bacteroidota bacterium]